MPFIISLISLFVTMCIIVANRQATHHIHIWKGALAASVTFSMTTIGFFIPNSGFALYIALCVMGGFIVAAIYDIKK